MGALRSHMASTGDKAPTMGSDIDQTTPHCQDEAAP